MDERDRGEPREQRRVLHRVPSPVAAPPQHRVAPQRAEEEAGGEEPERDERRAAHVREPALPEATGRERRDRERERDREPDEAGVEDRRVDDDERVVLQQRVRALSVGRDRAVDLAERIRREQHQQEEEAEHDQLHQRRPRDERILGAVAKAPRGEADVSRQRKRPQQDRAFERAPRGRERVETGRGARDVVGDVLDREVVREQRALHDDHRAQRAEQDNHHVAPRQPQQRGPVQTDAGCERRDAEHRGRGADREHRVAELRPHGRPNGSGGQIPLMSCFGL